MATVLAVLVVIHSFYIHYILPRVHVNKWTEPQIAGLMVAIDVYIVNKVQLIHGGTFERSKVRLLKATIRVIQSKSHFLQSFFLDLKTSTTYR